MESESHQMNDPQEIQVYRNDFISGILLLARKLFML
jgi:hypothetical protein